MKIKGAIFYMDGTLIDSLSFWDHLWGLIGARYMNDPAFRPCEEVDKAVRTMIYTDAMTYVKEYYGIGGSTEDFLRFTGNILPDFYKNVPSRYTPIGDVAVGEDVADAVWYFAENARNTTGAELVVDGGNTIQLYPIVPKDI